ncbi:hypothetical protein [Nocardia pseudobrasiliensis]|uniref:Neocarzinostatin family protein n=1 Tax=Nocardia pseudobrasiliensis TaxID=45979 RepID=A0A370I865_9NOCA|nr:hypothetical protein [Nocardia pseudobrasiliensis]RDI65564.1 hypothetical protein DFR76_106436 [Nocardia pseudobrasiliensis]
MKVLSTVGVLSAVMLAAAPVAQAADAQDANAGVFKVSHVDGSVIIAYDCPKGDKATITVQVKDKKKDDSGKGKAENLECTGKPTLTTVDTDLDDAEHGDPVTAEVSISATGNVPVDRKISDYMGSADDA